MYKEFIIDDYVIVNNKRFALNLNIYRNAHYHVLSDAKILFADMLFVENTDILKYRFNSAVIDYTIIPNNNKLFDTMNIISVVDKFFLDSIKDVKLIPDDDYKHVSYGQIRVADIEKTNKCKKILISCTFL